MDDAKAAFYACAVEVVTFAAARLDWQAKFTGDGMEAAHMVRVQTADGRQWDLTVQEHA